MIHPSSIVDSSAQIGSNVSIGPFSVIGPNVTIGDNTHIASHVVIEGHTTIGKNNKIFQYASIGAEPQSVGYKGEPTQVLIGDDNIFREFVTINRGTVEDAGVTRIGNSNCLMAYVHIAHDCRLGNNTIFVNCSSLAGHVDVGDFVIMGGFPWCINFVVWVLIALRVLALFAFKMYRLIPWLRVIRRSLMALMCVVCDDVISLQLILPN